MPLDSPTGHVNVAGFHPCQGVWHTPGGRTPKTAVISTHYSVDFSEHHLAPLLAARGIGFLGWNTRDRNNESWFLVEHVLVDWAPACAGGVDQSTADVSVFPSDALAIFDAPGSDDKDPVWVPERDHNLESPDDAREGAAALIAGRVGARDA